jgi:hypothetical protein
MITISAACSFASYDASTKRLTSSIVTIDDNTTIISNSDEAKVNGDVMFCADRAKLITDLTALGIKESDGTELISFVI